MARHQLFQCTAKGLTSEIALFIPALVTSLSPEGLPTCSHVMKPKWKHNMGSAKEQQR
ncbi:hypothetical protein P7K49_031596, partial [Saguinus oedipus]